MQVVLDPLVTISTLLACILSFGERIQGPYLILALIVFSLTFPGSPPRHTNIPALVVDVLTGWIAIVALLLLIGWTTRTLDSFDSRIISAWVLATPLALIVASLLMPVILPRVLAAEGVQRTAVIAGNGELGRELANRIRESPFLGVRFAGYFEDRNPQRIGESEPG